MTQRDDISLPAPPRPIDRPASRAAWQIKRCAVVWIIALLLVVVAVLLTARHANFYFSDMRVLETGKVVMGKIEAVGTDRVTDHRTTRKWAAPFRFAVRVRYQPETGRSRLGYIVIDPDDRDKYPIGDEIPIRYDPDSTRHMVAEGHPPNLLEGIWTIGLTFAISVVFFAISWLRHKRLLHLYRDGMAVPGLILGLKNTTTGPFSRRVEYAYEYEGSRIAGNDIAPQKQLVERPVGSTVQLLVDVNRPSRSILAMHFTVSGHRS